MSRWKAASFREIPTPAAATAGFLGLFAIPAGTPAFRTALAHMTLNLLVTVAYAANFGRRHGGYADGGSVGTGQLALSAVSVAALAVSEHLGGKLAYRYGVRVADEDTQAEGYTTGRPAAAAGPLALTADPSPPPHPRSCPCASPR
ncbi:DUF2231 domain-containing protein [Streptomyces sp. CA-181903]|uniref:DUF2231 domain-containing protein n=1 Tax=Streptomyces sp. CA-181903 TaxID=3240055 RepID=UPI003D92EA88